MYTNLGYMKQMYLLDLDHLDHQLVLDYQEHLLVLDHHQHL